MIWIIPALALLLILFRPWNISEAVWACSAALILILFHAISPAQALVAMGRGTEVYLFLTGMMLLSELARREGFFDWMAALAVRRSYGSRKRLFAIVYAVGVLVTIFLSNDATAVVLTPAVLAVVKKAKASPLPYLLICAFVANAASFVLPISNPANLVIYGSDMPPLPIWLRHFALPSLASIVATCVVLRWLTRKDLQGEIEKETESARLSAAGRWSAYGIAGTALLLMAASALNMNLGPATLAAALVTIAFVSFKDRGAALGIVKQTSWSIIPLVAGLFILVEAVNLAGALEATKSALQYASSLAFPQSVLVSAFGLALVSNVINNLPAGLMVGSAAQVGVSPAIRDALLLGVDLGPNLAVSGSLATILWLVALRRDGENITAWRFLRFGAVVMPVALLAATLCLL